MFCCLIDVWSELAGKRWGLVDPISIRFAVLCSGRRCTMFLINHLIQCLIAAAVLDYVVLDGIRSHGFSFHTL